MKESITMGIFGPNKKEAWGEFAKTMGAKYIDAKAFKNVAQVVLPYKFWEIVLDTYTVSTGKSSTTYTRIRAVYKTGEDFDFKIFKTTVFTRMAKALGRVYAPTGNEEFDNIFSIRSQQEALVEKTFENPKLREMFFALSRVYFQTKKSVGKKEARGVSDEKELYYQTAGIIKDSETLTIIFGIMIFLLDVFEANGIAKSENPKISYTIKGEDQ